MRPQLLDACTESALTAAVVVVAVVAVVAAVDPSYAVRVPDLTDSRRAPRGADR